MPAAETVARIERCEGCKFCPGNHCLHPRSSTLNFRTLGAVHLRRPFVWEVTDCPLAAGATNERGDE